MVLNGYYNLMNRNILIAMIRNICAMGYALGLVLACKPHSLEGQDLRKKALLVGIGKYPEPGGWNGLSSANDLEMMKNTLINQGFAPDQILVLSDEQATKTKILKAIQQEMLQKLKSGDIFYFHFSGHGQQSEDKNGDEQIDRLDECMVPYDSPKKFQPGVYEGENLITDDELGLAFENVRKKLGPTGHVVVVLDACHSGTGTRGFAQARGTTEIMASPDYLKKIQKVQLNKKESNKLQSESRGVLESQLAPMVSFFGASQNQLNYETTTEEGMQVGSLSYAISKCLSNAPAGISYRGLFDKIRTHMSVTAPLQQPQVEGELDMDVFNGKLLGKASYFRVVNAFSEKDCQINGGTLQSLHKGAVIGFYQPDTRDFENALPLARGTVQKSMLMQSNVVLDSALPAERLKACWAYVLESSLGDIKAKISLDLLAEQAKTQLTDHLRMKSYIEITDTVTAQLIFAADDQEKNKFYLMVKPAYTLDSFIVGADGIWTLSQLTRLNKLIRKYIQGAFYRKLDMQAEEIKVSFQIIPQDSMVEGSGIDELKPLQLNASSSKELAEHSIIRLLVHNEGIKPAYFCLLDIQPDNVINPLLPDQHTTAEELRILPGQKILISTPFKISPPYGTEMFKLIASAKPMDLKSTIGTRGFGPKNPFEKLYQELDSDEAVQTRGGKSISLPSSEINVFSDTFIITE